jgi:hypothetical protein
LIGDQSGDVPQSVSFRPAYHHTHYPWATVICFPFLPWFQA